MARYVLGVSALYHDSAACLLRDGAVVAAAQEERFTRIRHDAALPRNAVNYCLSEAGIRIGDVDHLVFYDKPFLKFERMAETFLAIAPRGLGTFVRTMPSWLREKLWTADLLGRELGWHGRPLFAEHHESHAASAFYPSPFSEAAILTVDGVGEWTTTSYGVGRGRQLELLEEIRFPHSLGLLYSAFTLFCGFKVNSGEYKLMGLAPYGEPRYADLIRKELIDLKDDGSFRLDLDHFEFQFGRRMVGKSFERLFGGPARRPDDPVGPREMDLARSVQVVIEEAMLRLARRAHEKTGLSKLCLAGGVALNCVANGRLLREGPFDAIWIQPAAGDAGGALGAALSVWHGYLKEPRLDPAGRDAMHAALLGPAFETGQAERALTELGAVYSRVPDDEVPAIAGSLISGQKVVGFFQGRMEFGPRALGARSILGDARSPEMQSTMNLKIKFRESFRPFAPSVLAEHAAEWFELECESPYMLLVADVRPDHRIPDDGSAHGLERLKLPRSHIPAVTHVDGSARVQTVSAVDHPVFHRTIQAFADKTACPLVVNTSFNVRGEPIVCTPEDAYRCFMGTNIDALVVGNLVLHKADQPRASSSEWKRRYEPD